ncbi:MAG: PQQ-binding-like beta-propeller repeat protein [Pirellulaceae bacterium]
MRQILTWFMLAFLFSAGVFINTGHAQESPGEQLLKAARDGDLADIKKLIDSGADVNFVDQFGITPIWQAALKGRAEAIKLLLELKANPDTHDAIWYLSPLTVTQDADLIRLLIRHGADPRMLIKKAAFSGDIAQLELLLPTRKWTEKELSIFAAHAVLGNQDSAVKLISDQTDDAVPELDQISETKLKQLVGKFSHPRFGLIEVSVDESSVQITGVLGSRKPVVVDESHLEWGDNQLVFQFKNNEVAAANWIRGYGEFLFEKSGSNEERAVDGISDDVTLDLDVAAKTNWPGFRGPSARGIAVDQRLPDSWDGMSGENVIWKTPIPGLANACPTVWGDRVFIATAVPESGNDDLKIGIYGDIATAGEESENEWLLYSLSSDTGDVVWKRSIGKSKPPIKRHTKSSQANSTPATDGKHVVAIYNSGDLVCFDFDGELLWERDLGVLDSGAFNDPEYQWGFGSSPTIYDDLVIVQCDLQEGSFVVAFDLASGEESWKTMRDEPPSWGSPTVYRDATHEVLITNGSTYSRGYNPRTGEELWRLGGHSAITVPTPFVAQGLIYLLDGYRPFQPVYAVKLGARGDITLGPNQTSSSDVAWSQRHGAPYLVTPIVYRGFLYSLTNSGILSCIDAKSGELVYKKRVSRGGANSFTGSLVAADGRLYLTAESGAVLVVKTGPTYELLATNELGEFCLSTPAIAGGKMFFKTHRHVIAVGSGRE